MTSILTVGGLRGAAVLEEARGLRESKVDLAYTALKQAIVSGALAPQTLIDKNEWSAHFGVSRLSITSALNRLAFERLVVIEPQRGSYVSKIRLTDAEQWMMMRRVLEMEVVANCAIDMPEPAIQQLGQNLAYQRAALDSGDVQGFHELDTRFHRQMADGLELVRVSEVLDPVRTHLERVRRTLLPEPGRMEETFVEHEEILSASALRRPKRARDAMGLHLDHVLRQLRTFVEQHPGFFED